jgi:hypothetical protein
MKRKHITLTIGSVLVIRQSKETPTDAEWSDSIQQVRTVLSVHGMNSKALIDTDGGGLNARQRDDLKQAIEKMPIPVAVLSDSVFARLLASTFALFDRNLRSFSVAGMADAFAFLGLSGDEKTRVKEALERMSAQLE